MGRNSDESGVSARSHLDEDTLSKIEQWEKEVDKLYRRTDVEIDESSGNLAEAATRLVSAIDQTSTKYLDKRKVFYLYTKLIEARKSDSDILGNDEERHEVFELLRGGKYYDVIASLLPKRTKDDLEMFHEDILQYLFKSWSKEFKGASLTALCRYLEEQERTWSHQNYYAKTIPVIQSSGMGKSRLLSELGKTTVSVYYTTRDPHETGYPPGDKMIRDFFFQHGDNKQAREISNVLAISLLTATFKELYTWCSGYLETNPDCTLADLAEEFHTLMAPVSYSDPPAESPLADTSDMSSKILMTSSKFRTAFCSRVRVCADSTYDELAEIKSFTKQSVVEMVVASGLRNSVEVLISLLKKRRVTQDVAFPDAVLVFDEASEIPEQSYYALCRILRELRDFPIWTFFLSTQSQMDDIAPPMQRYRSSRVSEGQHQRCEPFVYFQTDIDICDRLAKDSLYENEMSKSLSLFHTQDHMVLFGRPLWEVYKDAPWDSVRAFALHKLLCGSDFNPGDHQHAFAVIASRVSLDPCKDAKGSTEFTAKAVDSHLRILTATNIQDGIFTTITPSEPIVAEAVTNLMIKPSSLSTEFGNWSQSISTMAASLIKPGFVNKGLKGELYARLMCILARDIVFANNMPEGPFPCAQPFSTFSFVQTLFGAKSVDSFSIRNISSTRTRAKTNQQPFFTFQDAFRGSLMNFTHFVQTNDALVADPTKMKELLHSLMYSQKALQLHPNQRTWDLLLPIYSGDPSERFDRNMVSAIVVQVKNSKAKHQITIGSEYKAFFGRGCPVIYLLLDLGVSDDQPEVTYQTEKISNGPTVHCIHAVGAKASTFGCLTSGENLEAACALLFQEISQGAWLGRTIDEGHSVNVRGRFGKSRELLDACRKPNKPENDE